MSSGSESGDDVKHVEGEEDTSLANSDVTTKYQEAAKIANAALEGAWVLFLFFRMSSNKEDGEVSLSLCLSVGRFCLVCANC
jgi:hypothetical protein